jgi:hypothetical protein
LKPALQTILLEIFPSSVYRVVFSRRLIKDYVLYS